MELPKIFVRFVTAPDGKYSELQILSPKKSLHLAEYLEIVETWLTLYREQHKSEIAEYEDLKNSGKLVSISTWKKPT